MTVAPVSCFATVPIRPPRFLLPLAVALALCTGCNVTPLPTPPTVEPTRMLLIQTSQDEMELTGLARAASPPGLLLRATTPSGPSTHEAAGDDGSFLIRLAGRRTDVIHIEGLLLREDLFLRAVTGGPAEPEVVDADPGADGDGDDSPDAVDCAPGDPALAGSRCDPTGCTPVVETCNGRDDDCDGAADEGCPMCRFDTDCAPTETCEPIGGRCVDMSCIPTTEVCNSLDDDCNGVIDDFCDARCVTDSDCPAGQTCDPAGTCVGDPAGGACRADTDCPDGTVCTDGVCGPAR